MSVRLLRRISIVYLLIPNLLFYIYWTRPTIAVAGIVLLLYIFTNQTTKDVFSSEKILHVKDWVYIGFIAVLLTILSGTTGISWQTFDHWGHNTKFNDLLIHQWPLRYPESGPATSYYYGYFLVPALFSKIVGSINQGAIFFWTCLGLSLGMAWLYLVLNEKMVYVLLCFCIGDSSSLLWIIAQKLGIKLYVYGDVEIVMWSLTNSLLFMPNQVIPTLIIGGMLVYLLKNKLDIEEITFPIALSLWWAVFPALTSGLLAGVLIVRKWVKQRSDTDWSEAIKRVFLPALACLPVLLLYTSHQEVPISGLVWTFGYSVENVLMKYLINIVFNLLLFLLVFKVLHKDDSDLPAFPFYLLIALMLILPVYRMGVYNDLLHRGMMPYTLIIALYLLQPLSAQKSFWTVSRIARQSLLHFVLLYVLLFSSYVSLIHIKNALKINLLTAKLFPSRIPFKPFPYDAYPTSYDFLKGEKDVLEAKQYLGKEGSIYEQYIRKSTQP